MKAIAAIPYYACANRGKGEMKIWFPTRVKDIEPVTDAAVQKPFGK